MGTFERTRQILITCFGILIEDKTLLLFPLISGLCTALVSLSFIPMFDQAFWHHLGHASKLAPKGQEMTGHDIAEYTKLFMFYFCNYFVITFFNTALVACAMRSLKGEVTGFRDGMAEASARIPQIAGWAFICAIVGVILKIVESRSKNIAVIISTAIGGIAFSIGSFLVIPIMVAENKGPIDAFMESTRLFKKTWGERLISGFGFGLAFIAVALPSFGLFILAFVLPPALAMLFIALAFFAFMAAVLAVTAAETVFRAALYTYAATGKAPDYFDSNDMKVAFTPGKAT
ncbi:MAG: DUF6159 family protein [Alphaproteobacteria bacterium]